MVKERRLILNSLTEYKFIDIHYHASPDLYTRRLNALDAGKCYHSLQGAVILKSHLGATSIQAILAQSLGLPVFPSVVLNHIAGGIDYRVIQRALAEYHSGLEVRMIVDFPTITGRKYQSKLSREVCRPDLSSGLLKAETLFNEKNQLKKEVHDILKMAKDYPIVLSTGHAAKEEIYCLIEACEKEAVPALLLNQPANPLTGLTAHELITLAQHRFVWVEQTALTYYLGHQSKEDFLTVLSSLPRVIYSSDLGQPSQMDIGQWVSYSKRFFNEHNLSTHRQKEICCTNAAALLAI